MIHTLADVKSVNIGDKTNIWQFAVIFEGCVIGKNCNICAHTLIEDKVMIGNNVTIKSGVFLWNGITVEDDVFIGPSVSFTNDITPRSKKFVPAEKTLIRKGASLGAGTTVLAGVIVGKYAMTGIGSVVTKDIPDHALVFGNPAGIKGWVDEKGKKLKPHNNSHWISDEGVVYKETEQGLSRL